MSCSDETATKIDQMVVKIVTEQHAKAKQILTDNIGKLHEIAKFLYENETITGEEFMEILNAKPESVANASENAAENAAENPTENA